MASDIVYLHTLLVYQVFIRATSYRSTLRCVTPRGRPRSVYRGDVERRFSESCDKMAKWPWRSTSMTLVFNTSQDILKMHVGCKFGDSCSNPLQLIAQTSQKFLEFWVKTAKMTLKVKVNDPYFRVGRNGQTVETTTKPARHAARTWRSPARSLARNPISIPCQPSHASGIDQWGVGVRNVSMREVVTHTAWWQCGLLFDPHCVVTSYKMTSSMLNHFRLHGHNPRLSINVVTKNCRVCLRIVKMAAPLRVHSFFFPSAYNDTVDNLSKYNKTILQNIMSISVM